MALLPVSNKCVSLFYALWFLSTLMALWLSLEFIFCPTRPPCSYGRRLKGHSFFHNWLDLIQWMRSSRVIRDLTSNAEVAIVLGSIPCILRNNRSEGRQMKQKFSKNQKIPLALPVPCFSKLLSSLGSRWGLGLSLVPHFCISPSVPARG